MSELTREQVEKWIAYLQKDNPMKHVGNYLLDHDAALRAQVEMLQNDVGMLRMESASRKKELLRYKEREPQWQEEVKVAKAKVNTLVEALKAQDVYESHRACCREGCTNIDRTHCSQGGGLEMNLLDKWRLAQHALAQAEATGAPHAESQGTEDSPRHQP